MSGDCQSVEARKQRASCQNIFSLLIFNAYFCEVCSCEHSDSDSLGSPIKLVNGSFQPDESHLFVRWFAHEILHNLQPETDTHGDLLSSDSGQVSFCCQKSADENKFKSKEKQIWLVSSCVTDFKLLIKYKYINKSKYFTLEFCSYQREHLWKLDLHVKGEILGGALKNKSAHVLHEVYRVAIHVSDGSM